MSPSGRKISAAALGLHLFLVTAFSVRDLAANYPARSALLPEWSDRIWPSIRAITSTILGERLSSGNVIRQAVAAYANAAGIENGYSYFAPGIPNGCKVVFELDYADGRTEYDFPHVAGGSAGYRVATLLDILGQLRYAPLREAVVRSLAAAVWQRHPEAISVRAVIAAIDLPTMTEFKSGVEKSYDIIYAYEFRPGSRVEKPVRR